MTLFFLGAALSVAAFLAICCAVSDPPQRSRHRRREVAQLFGLAALRLALLLSGSQWWHTFAGGVRHA